MQARAKDKVGNLQTIISKMQLEVCYATVVPEFGLRWADVSQAVRKLRLPMTPTSIAIVLTSYATNSLTPEETAHIVTRLKLKSMALQRRTWHVIKLTDQVADQPVNHMTSTLRSNIKQALRLTINNPNKRLEVQTVKLGDFLFISLQMITNNKEGSVLYVATPPGQAVALVSSIHSKLVTACVKGLGYDGYEDASLSGTDVPSLLRIYNGGGSMAADLPEYVFTPAVTHSGIDFTGKDIDMSYVKQALGPSPPLLDTLNITGQRKFFNPDLLNKQMKVKLLLKSDNVAQTLESWAVKGAILPTSDLFNIFYKIKSNNIVQTEEDEDET